MKVATIAQTRNNLSSLLKVVQHGETVLILDRDQPVARLEPVAAGSKQDEDQDEARLARLERRGVLRRAAGPPTVGPVEQGPGPAAGRVSLLAALLAERTESR